MIAKIILLAYIIVSPFFNYKYVAFMDQTVIKILILVAIVLISFIDIELAILSMIAFLLLLINIYCMEMVEATQKLQKNKEEVSSDSSDNSSIDKQTSEDMPILLLPAPTLVNSYLPIVVENLTSQELQDNPGNPGNASIPSGGNSIMSSFPEPYCVDDKYDSVMSNRLYEHNIDSKIKPYEAFVKQLSPDESLDLIQNNDIPI